MGPRQTMKIELTRHKVHNEFAKKVELISGQNLFACYQCGNCTAGCPVAFAMEIGPIRPFDIPSWDWRKKFWGRRSGSESAQCTSRCPKGIARVMTLRTIVLKKEGSEGSY
jgi:heterodisulfide reductase subunit C